MSEEIRDIYKEEIEEDASNYAALSDEEFEERVRARKARVRRKRKARKFLGVVALIVLFAVIVTMCGREIIKLKAENIALQQEQDELKEERNRLKKEVENSESREFLQEQIKKQLGLLNPGELLFTFDEEK